METILNLLQIALSSDWWVHIVSNFALWGLLYVIEVKLLSRKFKSRNVLLQLLLSNLIDLDHLLSRPIYDPSRCSLNNHLFHSYYFIPAYVIGLFTRFRYFFMGIGLHFFIDYIGCVF
ncbi:MAG: DUF6122 family protein [Candidatus Pacebacteria bacterium]|nr:DUF6122 family protein [Candidatus Paceibacterota bacterium]